jgi:hypothetical protein
MIYLLQPRTVRFNGETEAESETREAAAVRSQVPVPVCQETDGGGLGNSIPWLVISPHHPPPPPPPQVFP